MSASRYSQQEVIDAYLRTGSVWRAGKELGLCGQSVHERLVAIGYPMGARHWTPEEVDELRSLVGHVTIGEIARRLGRPYGGVAGKISTLGIGERFGVRRTAKIPRGAGYDKASIQRYIKQLDESGDTIHRFARRMGIGVEPLIQSIEKNFPEWWVNYRETHSDLPEAVCPYCSKTFVPSNKKQRFCRRKCSADARVDDSYFGGKRRQTIGLAEGRCQLCGRSEVKALSSHHVLGKENDPENDFLIALCSGCHKAVTLLASRTFVDDPVAWQALISLVWLRKHGPQRTESGGVEVYVELDEITLEEAAAMDRDGTW